jgi:tetratricopeptide (TPR) repeat protein
VTDLYECCAVLGVSPGVTADEAKRAYRDLVREWHPDRLHHDPNRQQHAEARLKQINVAYGVLEEYLAAGGTRMRNRNGQNGSRPPSRPKRSDPAVEEARLRKERARAALLHERGEEHFTNGRWEDAATCLIQSVCLVQNNPDAFYTLGLSYRMLQLPAKAASAFKQVIRLRPVSVMAYEQLGQTLLIMGEARDVLAASSQILRIRPNEPGILVNMGAAYRSLKRFSQAQESIERALRVNPDHAQAHYELGMTRLALGDETAAREEVNFLRNLNCELAGRLLISIATSGRSVRR